MSLICIERGCKPLVKTKACGHKLYYRFKIRGHEFRKSTKTTDYKLAVERHNKAYVQHEAEVYEMEKHPERVKEREEARNKPLIPTFATYAALPRDGFEGGGFWLDYGNAQYAKHPRSREFFYYRLKALLKFEPLANCRLDAINWDLIKRFRSERVKTAGNNTTNQDVKALGLVLRIAFRDELIDRLPRLPGRKEGLPTEKRGLDISKEEEDRYFAAITERGFGDLRDLALLALDAGLEPGRVVVERLDWSHIHLEKTAKFPGGWVHDPFTKTVTRARDLAILTERLHQTLSERWIRMGRPKTGVVFRHREHLTRPVAYNTLYRQHESLWKGPRALEIRYFRPYDLRHTFGTRVDESGVDSRTFQQVMGWSSLALANTYSHRNRNRIALGVPVIRRHLAELGIIDGDERPVDIEDFVRRLLSSAAFQRFLEEG